MLDTSCQLYKYTTDIHKLLLRKNLDWLRLFCGREGQGGKSTLSLLNALWVNPDFEPETQVIYDLESFNNYLETHTDKPGMVALFDEAVLLFLGSEATSWEARKFQKLFTTHRDLNQEYYLCSPSPWRLVPYIREDRANDFLLGYMNPLAEDLDRICAYYNRSDYNDFLDAPRAKSKIRVPSKFIKEYKPTFKEDFVLPKSTKMDEIYNRIFKLKKEAQANLRQEIREGLVERKAEEFKPRKSDMLLPIVHTLVTLEGYTITKACEIVGISREAYRQSQEGINNRILVTA